VDQLSDMQLCKLFSLLKPGRQTM